MQDYKRLNDNNEGPNTGGMGACGPLGADDDQRQRFLALIKEKIFAPALKAMVDRGQPFSGLLYAGLMLSKEQPYLLEFNVRFGDPETQALLFGTKPDIYSLLSEIAHGRSFDMDFWQAQLLEMMPSVSIVLASTGYPSQKSPMLAPIEITTEGLENTKLFYAATTNDDDGQLCAASGRIMSVVARASSVARAQALGYEAVRKIEIRGHALSPRYWHAHHRTN